jgi:hypothetical protein
MTEREMIEVARPCVRNELNRCEQKILMIERSKPTPEHLQPANYIEALNQEATRLRTTLDSIDAYLGLSFRLESATDCAECEGSGESGHTSHDGTQYSTKEPPCGVCGGSGKTR